MNMPGFSAEVSAYRASNTYCGASGATGDIPWATVRPQQGGFDCIGTCSGLGCAPFCFGRFGVDDPKQDTCLALCAIPLIGVFAGCAFACEQRPSPPSRPPSGPPRRCAGEGDSCPPVGTLQCCAGLICKDGKCVRRPRPSGTEEP